MREPPVKPIEWLGDCVRIIDQRELPGREAHLEIKDAGQMAQAITTMAIRGAPLIGIAAAMGLAVEAGRWMGSGWSEFRAEVEAAIAALGATRPTASNLFWALGRMRQALAGGPPDPRSACDRLRAEALKIYGEDLETGRKMGEIGAPLIGEGMTVLTHCNAGGLATSGYGTALAPMYVARERGVKFKVLADETRPLLQGARLTAWELARAGIDTTVICDSAAHSLLARGLVGLVLVGSDRITLDGDFANKIGTYGVALSAKAAGVPFYVVAPTSTIDFKLKNGSDIPIEERDPSEVTVINGRPITPAGVKALNPAFDVTPAHLVTGIITEMGLVKQPLAAGLAKLEPPRG
ncbi:MAG TPA: S-methyl-5-thioribose-1-phosphate isomerase [bacterium]|nr:S-methyl-5-thioribose-1-phosphate isomerase [bacterium]